MRSELGNNLLGLVPALRAFAFCLTQNQTEADDLVYRSLIQIWLRHSSKTGLEFKMAAFSVVDAQFHEMASTRPSKSWPAARPHSGVHDSFATAFASLARHERKALTLVVAGAFNYEQTAKICSTDTRTIERRVANACFRLEPTLQIPTSAASSDGSKI